MPSTPAAIAPYLLLAAALTVAGAEPVMGLPLAQQPAKARPDRMVGAVVNVLDLASVRRVFHAIERRRDSLTAGELVAAWTDVSMVVAAVAGDPAGSALTFEELRAASPARPAVVHATPGVARRDAEADRLLALGYSARETADVLSRRISQGALDTARRMIAVGQPLRVASDYLDRQYRETRLALLSPRTQPGRTGSGATSAFDAFIDRYAALHRVEAGIVRAIIATESNFNPVARSPAGAIGLMQLMPGTARELGVNPLVPEQNIEGGVRYFAQLLKMFGKVELALVAYNAGPGFAERYARGQTGLYGETRAYVARVLGRLGLPADSAGASRHETR